MNKIIFAYFICFLMISPKAFALARITLPTYVDYIPDNASKAFADIVKNHFAITADTQGLAKCETKEPYLLRAIIYRRVTDKKFVAVYRAQGEDLTMCWINLESYSSSLIYFGKGWSDDTDPQTQLWCNQAGLLNPSLCAIISI